MPDRIFEEWKKFFHAVYPEGAAPQQLREVQNAFYAGGAFMFDLMTQLATERGEDEAGAVQDIEEVHQELERYAAELVRRQGGSQP